MLRRENQEEKKIQTHKHKWKKERRWLKKRTNGAEQQQTEDSNETFFEYSSSEHGSVGNANFYDAKLDSETIKIPDWQVFGK